MHHHIATLLHLAVNFWIVAKERAAETAPKAADYCAAKAAAKQVAEACATQPADNGAFLLAEPHLL